MSMRCGADWIMRLLLPATGKSIRIHATRVEAMQRTLSGRLPLDGTPLSDVDADALFRIEKLDKSYLPHDRGWFDVRTWT